jgi:proteasome assembly chaperone (PAC2) family protein
MLYDGLYNIFIGFMEAQVNLVDGSRWGPESVFKKYYPSRVLTVVSDSVVEKVRIELYYISYHV